MLKFLMLLHIENIGEENNILILKGGSILS